MGARGELTLFASPLATRHALIVTGPPRTKKSHNEMVLLPPKSPGGKPRRLVMPSKAWRVWKTTAGIQRVPDGAIWELKGMELPEQPYNCRALFYRDRAGPGDAVGYYQGLADLLEKRGVLRDDRWITQWDGTRILLDRLHPRVEIILEAI